VGLQKRAVIRIIPTRINIIELGFNKGGQIDLLFFCFKLSGGKTRSTGRSRLKIRSNSKQDIRTLIFNLHFLKRKKIILFG
jgi:hypothetical protein